MFVSVVFGFAPGFITTIGIDRASPSGQDVLIDLEHAGVPRARARRSHGDSRPNGAFS
jgi:hypothetical protein